MSPTYAAELQLAIRLADEAAREIAAIAIEGFDVETKGDGSPVTQADLKASALICAGLKAAFPQDALLSEEAPFVPGESGRVWIIDPLDGTGDFAGHSGDYAVMIGLLCPVDGHLSPVLGVVDAPALARAWWASPLGAFRRDPFGHVEQIAWHATTLEHPRALISRGPLVPQALADLKRIGALTQRRGSVGVKIGLIADGHAALYYPPATGTSLWDCAAPHAIAAALGLSFTRADGTPIDYDALETPSNPKGIAAGRADLCAQLFQKAAS